MLREKPITVTKPSLPSLSELMPYLQEIWRSGILTNNGPLHAQLESELAEYLEVPYVSLFSNGTIALITALKALNIHGEVITTPYSFPATAHSLLWNDLKPVFIDIEEQTLNLDPQKIVDAITSRTTAILPVHVYGYPCNVDEIEKIAQEKQLAVIYDAAHAFGVKCHCGSLLNHGSLSVLSFHATKVFNTFEGGAIVCNDIVTKNHIDQLKNFGFVNETTIIKTGINGKLSEFNAAVGLAQLKNIDSYIERNTQIANRYMLGLRGVNGISCHFANMDKVERLNYSYFPILVRKDFPLTRDGLYKRLIDRNVFGRRYFYPLLTDFPMYQRDGFFRGNLPIARRISDSVICLPIYPSLSDEEVDYIIDLLKEAAS